MTRDHPAAGVRATVLVAGEPDAVRAIPTAAFGTPEEVAGAVLYLAPDAAAFTTGTLPGGDGGWPAG